MNKWLPAAAAGIPLKTIRLLQARGRDVNSI